MTDSKNFRKGLTILLVAMLFAAPSKSQESDPIMYWDFDNISNRTATEKTSGIADTLEGNFGIAPGIKGDGLRLDGFTACVRRTTKEVPVPGDEFTVEAWVSLGNYPWNWCPVLTTETEKIKGAPGVTKGYRLMIGAHGEVALQAAIGEQWITCSTEKLTMPLRKWMHIVGVYRENKEMAVYVNGELKASMPVQGEISYSSGQKPYFLMGMVAEPDKPSDLHRTWGTVAQYYGLNGIMDEIKVYDTALKPGQVTGKFTAFEMKDPDIEPHKLPNIEEHPGRFGAFYTELNYYDGRDNLWPVDQDPDIVVTFDKLPVKVMFWRGIRYGTSWVSENNNWMTDQSVESWGMGDKDNEGCFEHMQDRHCRFSHVRIIENNDARVVVHWRYAPVSAYNNTWRVDPKTGWECWIDEYHYIYPDATGIRKVSWKKGSLQYPRQFQESLPLLHPGQMESDLLHKDYVHVADYKGNMGTVSYVENPKEQDTEFARDYTVQQYNFKSENKPFICFEPGNRMNTRWNDIEDYNDHTGCNHFPVGQARCDGRTSTTSDRPSHCGSFPISYPVIHEKGDRLYWNGLYGINDMDVEEVVELGRSWAFAPDMEIKGNGFASEGYDRSERCYRIDNKKEKAGKCQITLSGSKESPVQNPALIIKNWNAKSANVLVDGKPMKDARIGVNHELSGSDLTVFLFLEEEEPVNITITP